MNENQGINWNKSWVRKDRQGLMAWFGQTTMRPPADSKIPEGTLIVLKERPDADDGSCFVIYGDKLDKMEIWMPTSTAEAMLRI